MEIITMILTILLVLMLVATAQKAFKLRHDIPFYIKLRNLIKKPKPEPPPPPDTRMFVAIRRHPAGRLSLSSIAEEEYEAHKNKIKGQMQQLLDGWATLTEFKWGFHGSEYGLPSSNEENWLLFASFQVADHDTFRACLAYLGQEQFLALRNQFDIRLLYGEKMEDPKDHLDELFS